MKRTSILAAAIFPLLIITLFSCKKDMEPAKTAGSDNAIFQLLPPEKTGVTFQNALAEGLNANILMYEYFYNGGGVAAGDFNGDGFIDLYFTSNMGANKLYLNEGDGLKFSDATQASGAGGREGPWKTGVNVADVNGDGRLDIYLCYSGAMPEEKRRNQLFINLGNTTPQASLKGGVPVPTFAEKAAEYGLASGAFSNQSYFLDYDRDGDLDLLLLNHNPKNLPVLNEAQTIELMKTDDPMQGIRLFRQENGRFSDVTMQAGISSSPLTYGLGIGISDFNDDGWADFYVSNDYNVPDYLYLNSQNGTFKNTLSESIGHVSQFSMGNDVADINNDGLPDLVTLDMLPEDNARQKLLLAPDNYGKFDLYLRSGFYYQFMRNMLHLNNGVTPNPSRGASVVTPLEGGRGVTFSEIGQLSGISNTDWSWSALAADYDNDGWKDLYVTNGYVRDYTNLDFINYMDDYVKKKGRLVREDVLEIIKNMPASDVMNYMFRGNGDLSFSNHTQAWGMAHISNSNGAIYADLDNDGDLDIVVNNVNKPAFIYENIAGKNAGHYLQVKLSGEGLNTYGIGAKVRVFAGQKQYFLEQNTGRGYLSAVSPTLHFGLGDIAKIDSLHIIWQSGKREKLSDISTNQIITLEEKNAKPYHLKKAAPKSIFTEINSGISWSNPPLAARDFDRQKLLIGELSNQSPCMATGDLNKDGLEDIFIGGAPGQSAAVFLQAKNGKFSRLPVPAFEQDKTSEDADAAIFDANADGNLDIYVATGGYHDFQPGDPRLHDKLFLGDGKGNFTKSTGALPALPVSNGCVAVADFNGDGHFDVFTGGRVVPGRYPEMPASHLLMNDGKGKFTDQTAAFAPELAACGMVCDAAWADLNQDRRPDLVVAGEWMPVMAFINQGGKLKNESETWFGKPRTGFWNRLETADLNGDQRPDFIVGNLGTNTQITASEAQPAELYFADFDKNGSVDPLLCTYVQGKSYPYLTRDELLQQLAGFRKQFTSYASYADVTMTDLFDRQALSEAGHLTVNHLETSVLLSAPGGKYAWRALPVQAQFAPVYAIRVLDFDKDGKQDLLLCGNNSRLKLRLGKADANYGMLFRADGTGNFSYVDQATSGLHLRGDVRSVAQVGDMILFGINQGTVAAYR